MHSAVLADFSRCLHVRKRTHSPPSDLGNRRPRSRATRAQPSTTQPPDERLGGNTQRRKIRGCLPLLRDIVCEDAKVEKAHWPRGRKKPNPERDGKRNEPKAGPLH